MSDSFDVTVSFRNLDHLICIVGALNEVVRLNSDHPLPDWELANVIATRDELVESVSGRESEILSKLPDLDFYAE